MNRIALLFITMILCFKVNAKAPIVSPEDLLLSPPKIIRACCSFGSNVKMAVVPFIKYTDISSFQNIGKHSYLGCKSEQNGIIYTQKGGFIDMGHLRDCADWTAYLYNLISSHNEGETIVQQLGREGGKKTLTIKVPSKKDKLLAYELAGKIAYDLSIWHEIATWYGSSYFPFIPERYSSFSPEDLFSNLLGVTLGMKALQSNLEYDEAMSQLIASTMDSLGCVESAYETFMAMEMVENLWWTRSKNLPSKKILLKRYMGTDSVLIPWLVPELNYTCQVHTLAKPSASLNAYYEFKVKLNGKFPIKRKFTPKPGRVITQKDFPLIVQYITNDVDKLNKKMEKKALRKNERKEKRLQRIMKDKV